MNNTTYTFVKRKAFPSSSPPPGHELLLNKLFKAHHSDKNLPQQKSDSAFSFFLIIVIKSPFEVASCLLFPQQQK